MRTVFLVLTGLCLVKEVNDFFVLNNSLVEQLLDTLATFAYPLVLLLVVKLKAKAERAP